MVSLLRSRFLKYFLLRRVQFATIIQAHRLLSRRKRRYYVRTVNLNRRERGEFNSLLQELREEDPERHFTYFRMSKQRYDALLAFVDEHLQHKKNHRFPISSSQRLAVTLRLLATGDSFGTVAASFRLGKTTVCAIFHETCEVLYRILQPLYLPAPTTEHFEQIADDFMRFWHYPRCVGALDGKHVVVQAPPNSGGQHLNYKGTFSVVLLALVDARYCFTVVDVGGFGKQSDGGTFAKSEMGRLLAADQLGLPKEDKLPGSDSVVPHVIVADEAFPLKSYMMRPYPGKHLNRRQKIFNYRLSRARRIVENVFGILASRWRIYRRAIIASATQVDKIILATVVLHNFLRQSDDAVQPSERYLPFSWTQKDDDISVWNWEIENEVLEGTALQSIMPTVDRNPTEAATVIRDTFALYFTSDNGSLPWQDSIIDRGLLPS